MNELYKLLDALKDALLADGMTKTVRMGDPRTIDQDKTTLFSKVLMDVVSAEVKQFGVAIRMGIIAADIVDKSKDTDPVDEFYGGNNLIDVQQTQLNVLLKLVNNLKRGPLADTYELTREPAMEAFQERFDNDLAGWAMDIEILIPNMMSSCVSNE